jgi:hypothetical protein
MNARNTGRRTAEEGAKLIKAVMVLGNDWVRVGALVPGRKYLSTSVPTGGVYLGPAID